jgi:tetratricopeptide (TPR) repeat protein
MRSSIVALVLALALFTSARADDHTDCKSNPDRDVAMAACDRLITQYTAAIEKSASPAELFYKRGVVNFMKRDVQAAIADFGEAIRLEPQDPNAFVNRAVAYFELDDNAHAIADMDAAIKLAPKAATLYQYRGKMHLDSGNADRAIADFQQLLKLDPSNEDVKALLRDLGVEVK